MSDMMVRFTALMMLFESTAFSAGDLRITELDGESSTATAQAYLAPAPADGAELTLTESAPGAKPVKAKLTALPANLWVLVDSSALCQTQKVDAYINRVVHALKRQANPQSFVTVVAYTSESMDLLLPRRPVGEIGELKLECEKRPFSASYDRAIAKLLEDDRNTKLPTVAWVFTSGNIELSKKTAAALTARNIELQLVLYNEFVEKDVRSVWDATQAPLRGIRTRFAVLPKIESGLFFPSMSYRVEFPVARAWRGSSLLLQAAARPVGNSAAEPTAKTEVSFAVPLDGGAYFWRRYGRWMTLAALLALAGYGIYRLYHYYRPRRCGDCRRPLSFRYEICLFCRDHRQAFLVGTFRKKRDGFGNPNVAPAAPAVLPVLPDPSSDRLELGSHRKSPLRFPRVGRRRSYARIEKDTIGSRPVYRIVRNPEAASITITVNGRAVTDSRCLASGDRLQVDSIPMTFYFGGNDHA